MALRDKITTIVGGDQAKLARLREILSWFGSDWEVVATVKAMGKHLTGGERDEIYSHSRDGVRQDSIEFIEYLLWVMEQTDLEERMVRCRWWAYRSRIEHP
ncbi:hypothetical protein D1007_30751 [Hordeum vulgare]|nr:hypothetical protein D1007_30751 [Hordeum vulgare]